MADQNCAHFECNCKVEQGKGVSKGANAYCSDRCANATPVASDKCQCGHPGCS
jgi:hypothetical protein